MIDKLRRIPVEYTYMAVFGLNPFAKKKGKKTTGKKAMSSMKKLKKKAKTCEFC